MSYYFDFAKASRYAQLQLGGGFLLGPTWDSFLIFSPSSKFLINLKYVLGPAWDFFFF